MCIFLHASCMYTHLHVKTYIHTYIHVGPCHDVKWFTWYAYTYIHTHMQCVEYGSLANTCLLRCMCFYTYSKRIFARVQSHKKRHACIHTCMHAYTRCAMSRCIIHDIGWCMPSWVRVMHKDLFSYRVALLRCVHLLTTNPDVFDTYAILFFDFISESVKA